MDFDPHYFGLDLLPAPRVLANTPNYISLKKIHDGSWRFWLAYLLFSFYTIFSSKSKTQENPPELHDITLLKAFNHPQNESN